MRLALSENRVTKWKDLRHELTPRDLSQLIAFWSLEPWGDRRADIRHSLMTAVIVSATNGEKIDLDRLTNYMDADLEPNGEDGQLQSPNAAAATMVANFPSTIR